MKHKLEHIVTNDIVVLHDNTVYIGCGNSEVKIVDLCLDNSLADKTFDVSSIKDSIKLVCRRNIIYYSNISNKEYFSNIGWKNKPRKPKITLRFNDIRRKDIIVLEDNSYYIHLGNNKIKKIKLDYNSNLINVEETFGIKYDGLIKLVIRNNMIYDVTSLRQPYPKSHNESSPYFQIKTR